MGCKDKNYSCDLIGFPDGGSIIGSTLQYLGEIYRYTVHAYIHRHAGTPKQRLLIFPLARVH